MARKVSNSALAAIAGAPVWLILAGIGGIWLVFRGPGGVKEGMKDIGADLAKEIGGLLIKPVEVLGILAGMVKEAHDRDLETEQMRRVIPSRQEQMSSVHAFVLNNGYMKMSQLAFLVSSLDEYDRLSREGHSDWYQAHPVAQAKALMNLVQEGLPVFYDYDLQLRDLVETAKKTGRVDVDRFAELKAKILMAEARVNSPKWDPWRWVMSEAGLAAAKKFRSEIEGGTYKIV